jgi:hypothetical protein
MENLSKAESLRQSLRIHGPSTSQALGDYTGIPIATVAALLGNDINKGDIIRGWRGKKRIFGLPGTLTALEMSAPVREKTAPHRAKGSSWAEPERATWVKPHREMGIPARCMEPAGLAVSAEQREAYSDAVLLWREAAHLSLRAENITWYTCRAEFCENAQVRGWFRGEVTV